nr:ABC transporter substrate-binding protein [Paludibacteraceae bacterium]
MKKIPFLLLPCFVLFIACTHGNSHLAKEQPVDSLLLSHAEGFSIRYFQNYKEVVVFNPFSHNAVYQRYYLVRDTDVSVPADGLKIKIPVRSLAATSVTHFEFLNLLHVIDAVTGVCSSKIIYSPQINERLNKGLIVDLGDAFNINLEKTVQLHPDLVMVSGYNQNDPFAQRLLQAGIFPVYNNEWMEKSLLGRAEWIKFVAVFFDKEKIADSLYLEIEKEYQNTANRVKGIKFRPQIMSGSNFRGTWY